MAQELGKATAKNLDFSEEGERGEYSDQRIESGLHVCKVVDVKEGKANDGKSDMWVFGIAPENYPHLKYAYHCVLKAGSLWKVRDLFRATGSKVDNKPYKINPQNVVGKKAGFLFVDTEWKDKPKSKVDGGPIPAKDVPSGKSSGTTRNKATAVDADEIDPDIIDDVDLGDDVLEDL